MRYILHYNYRLTGQPAENVHAGEALLDAFSGWKPPEGLDIREFIVRVDGRGGTIICDTDIPSTIYLVTTQYSGWMDWDVQPGIDITAAPEWFGNGLAWAHAALTTPAAPTEPNGRRQIRSTRVPPATSGAVGAARARGAPLTSASDR